MQGRDVAFAPGIRRLASDCECRCVNRLDLIRRLLAHDGSMNRSPSFGARAAVYKSAQVLLHGSNDRIETCVRGRLPAHDSEIDRSPSRGPGFAVYADVELLLNRANCFGE